MELALQPHLATTGGEPALSQQPSLDLGSLLAASDFSRGEWLLPKDTALSPSANTASSLPHSLPIVTEPASRHTTSPPALAASTSGDGSSGNERAGTGHNNLNNSNDAYYLLQNIDNNDPANTLPLLLHSSRSRAKSAVGKRRKVRPKDKLDALQKQFDNILQQVQALTLVNQELHRKNDVLSTLLLCSQHVEKLSVEALQQREAYLQNPAGPHEDNPAAVIEKLTPEGFMATYNGFLAEASRWVVQAGELDGALSEEAAGKLELINRRLMDYLTKFCTLRKDIIKGLKELELEQFKSKTVSEEEHWLSVLHMLQLQPEQEARMLLARDVFMRSMDRLQEERIGLGQALSVSPAKPGSSDSYHTGEENEALLERVMRSMSKSHNMAQVLGHWLYTHTLTPLQTAKAILHSHPIMPKASMLFNVLAVDMERRSSSSGPDVLGRQAGRQQGPSWQTPMLHTARVS